MATYTLSAILPFALASAISPVLLSTSILMLGQTKPLRSSVIFLLGCLSTIVVIGAVIVVFDYQYVSTSPAPDIRAAYLHGALALVLLFFAAKNLLKTPSSTATKKTRPAKPLEVFALGVVLMATNYTSIIMYFPVATMLNSGGFSVLDRYMALAIMVFFTTLPALLAPLVLLLARSRAKSITQPLAGFVNKNTHYVSGVFFGAIGLYLLYRSLVVLL